MWANEVCLHESTSTMACFRTMKASDNSSDGVAVRQVAKSIFVSCFVVLNCMS
jgi:hypothetical protein